MAYKFQLGAARLGGSLVQEGNITAESSQVTASLVTASAVHVPDAALHLNGTAVTATAAELNYLDGADSNISTLVLPASTTISAFAKSFLDDSDEATFKATVNLEIGVDVQAWDADLDTIAGLAKTDGNFIVADGSGWVVESGATARTSLGLGSMATQNSGNVDINGGFIDETAIGKDAQSYGKFTYVSASQGLTGSLQFQIESGEGIKQFNFRNGSDVVVQLTSSIAGSGLAYNSGVLSVDLSELTEAVVNVETDSFIFIDNDGNVTRKETLVDYATAIAGAGLAADTGVLEVQVSGAVKIAIDKVGISGSIAGNGISYSGGVDSISSLSVDFASDGALQFIGPNADQLSVKLEANKGLSKSGNGLATQLKAESGGTISVDASGLYIANAAISNAKLATSTISGKALGTNLDSLTTAGSNSGITMSSYNGSAAVSDLAINLASSNALVLTNGLDLKTQISGDRQFTGTVTINNLNVTGTLTTVNTTELEVKDKNILIASGSADAATAAGAGITVDGAGVQWKYAVNGLGAAAASGDVWMASGSAGLIDIQAETFYGNLVGAASMPVYSSSGNANLFPGVMVYVGSSAVTFTLPLRSSVPVGSSIKVKGNDSTSSTNKITIQRSGSSDLIDLETSIDLESPFAAIELIAGPSSWLVF